MGSLFGHRRPYQLLCAILLMVGVSLPISTRKSAPLLVGFWSSWNIPCGIAMYTKHVSTNLEPLNCKTFAYSHTMPLEQLKKAIIKDRIQVLNIQYEAGIMPPLKIYLDFVKTIKQFGVKVVVTMHDEPDFAQSIVEAADFTIYHKQPYYVKGLKNKIAILPMGVPVFTPSLSRQEMRKKYGYSDKETILVTTGFLLFTKELDVVLKLLAPHLKSHPTYRLQLLNSATPRNMPMCKIVDQKIKAVLNAYKLWRQVYYTGKFIPQEELSERIWMSDLGYQWFSMNTHASSGAVREFIAARLPVVVPRSSHYLNVNKGLVKVARDKIIFVREILQTLENKEKLKRLTTHIEQEYNRLNYQAVIRHYYNILKQCAAKK